MVGDSRATERFVPKKQDVLLPFALKLMNLISFGHKFPFNCISLFWKKLFPKRSASIICNITDI